MRFRETPCKRCDEWEAGCHALCKKYKEWRKEYDSERNRIETARHKESDYLEHKVRIVEKTKRK